MNIVSETNVAYMDDQKTNDLVKIARKGLTYAEFASLYDMAPFNLNDWARILSLSDRSLQRYQKSGAHFSMAVSEKLLLIGYLFNRGHSVFNDSDRFFSWLQKPSVPLGGQTPLSLLDSIFGIDLILDELGRIEHGIFS
ncbi:MAG: antitoxin Xre/MbcA/ParS toxin-binding domain-containing protein [Balneolales bacterium]